VLRFSFGPGTTGPDLEVAAAAVARSVKRFRGSGA